MIQDEKFSQQIIGKIKEEKMQPKAKWHFILKNYLLWLFGALSLLFGAISAALAIYMVRSDDLAPYRRLANSPLEFLFIAIPSAWILAFGLFITLLYLNIKNTKKGYRYPLILIALISMGASIALGFGIERVGFGEKIDFALGKRAPFYDRLINPRIMFWSNPDKGRLAGIIDSDSGAMILNVVDNRKRMWIVDAHDARAPLDPIKTGLPARFVGKKLSENEFKAIEIMPFMSSRGFFNRFDHERMGSGSKGMIPVSGCPFAASTTPDSCKCRSGEMGPELKALIMKSLVSEKGDAKKLLESGPSAGEQLLSEGFSREFIDSLLK